MPCSRRPCTARTLRALAQWARQRLTRGPPQLPLPPPPLMPPCGPAAQDNPRGYWRCVDAAAKPAAPAATARAARGEAKGKGKGETAGGGGKSARKLREGEWRETA